MEAAVHALLALVTDHPPAKTAVAGSDGAAVLVNLLSGTWAAHEGILLGAVLALRHCATGCPTMQDAVRLLVFFLKNQTTTATA